MQASNELETEKKPDNCKNFSSVHLHHQVSSKHSVQWQKWGIVETCIHKNSRIRMFLFTMKTSNMMWVIHNILGYHFMQYSIGKIKIPWLIFQRFSYYKCDSIISNHRITLSRILQICSEYNVENWISDNFF